MTSKKYTLVLTGLLFAFFYTSFICWHCAIKKLYTHDSGHGGFDNMGSFFYTPPTTPQAKYSKHHTEFQDYVKSNSPKNFDVLTIGDSFSTIAGGCFYQDYLADKYGLEVLNVPQGKFNALEMLYALDYSGWLDEFKPRFAILESVERSCNARFGLKDINLSINLKKFREKISNMAVNKDKQSEFKKTFSSIIVKANLKFVFDKIFMLFHDDRLSTEAYFTKLNQPLFTNPGQEDLLLFYWKDLDYLKMPFDTQQINTNFNKAAQYFSDKGIKILFMPCVDKFNLYYPYIEHKKYSPENKFFDEIETLDKNYTLINTKNILRKLLAQGEKDVYWLDDTHWSWKAQQAVGDEIAKILSLTSKKTPTSLSGR